MADPIATRKLLASWLPFATAVAVPLTLLLVMGAFSFEQTRNEAEWRARRSVQALAEHALRTFRAHDLIINAVDQHIAGWGWEEINSSRPLHEFFKGMMKNAEDINTIFVVGPTGREGNSSLLFPLAPTNMAGRPFYEELRRQDGVHLSEPDIGRLNKQPYFSFTRRRTTQGAFDGVISVSVNPGYFEKFYSSMAEGPADAVGLARADGLLLVRVPPIGTAEMPRLPGGPGTPGGLMTSIQTEPITGVFSQTSAVDGVRRIYAYRRVGEYPLYAFYGLAYDTVWSAWRRNVVSYALVCAVAMALLLAAAALMRGHARREADAAASLAREAARRLAAEENNRSKDEFLATLSHELRNPLASIAASTEILRQIRIPQANGAAALGIIGRQVEHLRRLLSDLLDVARGVYGKLHLDLEIVSLLDIASDAVASFPGTIRREVDITVGGTQAWVRADPTRLRQMIENLVDNAQKYGARHIALRVSEREGLAELSVTDDGAGIAPDLLPTLFEPFVQGKQALDRSAGGLGLGLALVHRLAVAHGGSIAARSDGPGKGSTFTIGLPALPQPAPAKQPLHEPPRPTGTRVLVVEDQPDARESLRMLLELDHHVVETASTGKEGVAKFDAFAPDVVLVDIGLPEMNGYEVARAIRSRRGKTEATIIALTGYGQPEDQRLALEAGFDVHLTKPVSYDDLKRWLVRG